LKRNQSDSSRYIYVDGGLDPDLQICLELLRFGEYQDVYRCFDDRLFTSYNYKVWVAKQRYMDRRDGVHYAGDGMFPAKAVLQLETLHGCVVFLCGVKRGDCLLRKLDHAGIKSEIASYLDFPKGLELEDLLVAAPKVARSLSASHPYFAKIGKDRGAELLQTLDLEPSEVDYGHSYAVDQLIKKDLERADSLGTDRGFNE
jgi:hypothetical protein